VSLIDFDGEYLDKRKNSSRTHRFTIFFTEQSIAAQFEDDTRDVRPIWFFDPIYNIDFRAHILSLAWAHEFTNNVDLVAFDITLQETTTISAYQKSENLPTLTQFNRKLDNIRVNGNFARLFNRICNFLDNLTAFLAQTFTQALSAVMGTMAEMEAFRLKIENIKKTGMSAFQQAMNLMKEMSLFPLKLANTMTARRQITAFLNGYSDLFASVENLKDPNLGNELYYAAVSPIIYCKCSIASGLNPQIEPRNFLVGTQDNLYADYSALIETVSTDRLTTSDKVQSLGNEAIKYLTQTIRMYEENLLTALQERKICFDHDRDIYPLLCELYPTTEPESFETAFLRFTEDNNLHADELFMIPAGKEIRYYV
jgi:hypothetical protein